MALTHYDLAGRHISLSRDLIQHAFADEGDVAELVGLHLGVAALTVQHLAPELSEAVTEHIEAIKRLFEEHYDETT